MVDSKVKCHCKGMHLKKEFRSIDTISLNKHRTVTNNGTISTNNVVDIYVHFYFKKSHCTIVKRNCAVDSKNLNFVLRVFVVTPYYEY